VLGFVWEEVGRIEGGGEKGGKGERSRVKRDWWE